MGIALDTSALVAVERSGASLIATIPEDTTDVWVPALVVAELWIGVELADSAPRRAARIRKIRVLLDGTTVLPFDERVAPTYARLYAVLRRAGTPIPSNDLAIGSLAVHFGHELLVGPQDEAHFRRIPDLTVRVLPGR
jgi:tRNA(fMet)-specific endonuclease VapC